MTTNDLDKFISALAKLSDKTEKEVRAMGLTSMTELYHETKVKVPLFFQERFLFTTDLREYDRSLVKGEATMSRAIEILNEKINKRIRPMDKSFHEVIIMDFLNSTGKEYSQQEIKDYLK